MQLILTMRTKNGRRKDVAFPVEKEVSQDPALRAQTISNLQLKAEGMVKNSRMANWRFEDGTIPEAKVLG